jgi:uncharacterized DUF497 family protein
VRITFDPAKREKTLNERGLDFADTAVVFDGPTHSFADLRVEYGEPRFITVGLLSGRMVMLAWTPTPDGRRIISMRKANEREQTRYRQRLG